MRFNQLKYLLYLKETGSISRTAEKMLISHQAVPKAIKSLENELSVTLLNRTAQRVAYRLWKEKRRLETVCRRNKIVFSKRRTGKWHLPPEDKKEQQAKRHTTRKAVPKRRTAFVVLKSDFSQGNGAIALLLWIFILCLIFEDTKRYVISKLYF